MKISCNVEIFNRQICSLNLKTKNRVHAATLALCHKPRQPTEASSDKDVLLIICTHQQPRGTKYKVFNNVDKMFTKFIHFGKATIRLKEPAHDIIISKADPLQLKGFIHGVGLTFVGKGTGKIHLSPAPTKVDRPKQKLSIMERKKYPLNTGFPQSLTWLQVSNCGLRKIEQRILRLLNLQVLDLSYNCIRKLPTMLSELSIKELILTHNEITDFPDELAVGALGKSLQILDLSENKISRLSPYFCTMKNIRVLSLKWNKISELPRNFDCMESLRMFSASDNSIKVLPFGIRKLHLNTLDLFHNPLDTDVVLEPSVPWQVPSLLEWSAMSIVQNDVKYGVEDVPPSLRDYIVERCPCPCGRLVFQNQSSCILVLDLHKLASSVVYINNTSRFKVPLQVYFCSARCWKKAIGH